MSVGEASSGRMLRRISVSLREDQYLGLEEVAEDMGVNLSDAAREAINAFLLRQHWGGTIGETAEEAIKRGLTNREALDLVLLKFPHAATSLDSIAWYRSQLRKTGSENVPTDREARARQGEREPTSDK